MRVRVMCSCVCQRGRVEKRMMIVVLGCTGACACVSHRILNAVSAHEADWVTYQQGC